MTGALLYSLAWFVTAFVLVATDSNPIAVYAAIVSTQVWGAAATVIESRDRK